ncbi:MAG: hypothetical protein AAGA90_01290 [Actinomycetota bacterium]
MHDSDLPPTRDDVEEADDEPTADAELDAIASDLDTVEAAMKALDADDFDRAEALAGSLEAPDTDPTEPGDATGAEPGPIEA